MVENRERYPVAIVGAGPVGLALACHLYERDLPFVVFEASAHIGASIEEWSHVHLFSPWKYLVDTAALKLLKANGWQEPDPEVLPTGREFLENYLIPLSQTPQIKPHIQLSNRVTHIGRYGLDKLKSQNRENLPFEIHLDTGTRQLAGGVADASGTWQTPNPIGSGGISALGEDELQSSIFYGIPDVLGSYRTDLIGKRVLVVGSGHSALTCILELLQLREENSATHILWAVRKHNIEEAYGGGTKDALPARGALGLKVKAAMSAGAIELIPAMHITSVQRDYSGFIVIADQDREQVQLTVDAVIGVTGFRPDLNILRELRVDLDPWVECPSKLAPLIDPNIHSCGTVPPHGIDELRHPEKDFYIIGMKSYGRAPTFLMITGYEQARSVAAMFAGDEEDAKRIELVLPETGVCKTDSLGEEE